MDNPLLRFLGRRGRPAVVTAVLAAPREVWHVRELADAADVSPMTASRALGELAALGAVELLRPGRDVQATWRPAAPAARFLRTLHAPDLRHDAAHRFAAHYDVPQGVTGLRWWQHPDEDPGDPHAPTRIAILVQDDDAEEAALEAIGPALDAVRARGIPVPLAETVQAGMLGDDGVSQAVRDGAPL